MFVKQIGMKEALRLASNGREIFLMAPMAEGRKATDWGDYTPDTLQHLLEGCLFFRKELAAELWDELDEGSVVSLGGQTSKYPAMVPGNKTNESQEGRTVTLDEQLQSPLEEPKNRPPDVWIPARLTEKEAGTTAR